MADWLRPSSFYTGLATIAFFGLSLAGLLMLTDLLITDLVDADELETGTRREGLYFGMNGFVIRFAFTIQGIITAVVLTVSGCSPATSSTAPPSTPCAPTSPSCTRRSARPFADAGN